MKTLKAKVVALSAALAAMGVATDAQAQNVFVPNVISTFGNAYGYPGGAGASAGVYIWPAQPGYRPPHYAGGYGGEPRVQNDVVFGGTYGAVDHHVRQPGPGRYRCWVNTGQQVPESSGDGYCAPDKYDPGR